MLPYFADVALIAIGGLIPDQRRATFNVLVSVSSASLFSKRIGQPWQHGERLNYRPILLLIIFAVELNDILPTSAAICLVIENLSRTPVRTKQ